MSSEITESAKWYEILAWLEINKKRVALGAVIAIGLGVLIAFFAWSKNQREFQADAALFKLGMPIQSSTNTPPPPVSAYLKVAEDYAGTYAGERALLQAAGGMFQEGRYADAFAQFSKFHSKSSDSTLNATAAFGVAACLDAQNRVDEALKAYQDVIQRYPAESGRAKLAAARLFEEKKQPESALKLYNELAQLSSMSPWSAEAQELRSELLLQYPRLAPTNAPLTTLSPTLSAAPIQPAISGTNAPVKPAGATSTVAPPARLMPSTNASRPSVAVPAPSRPTAPVAPTPPAMVRTNAPVTPASATPPVAPARSNPPTASAPAR